MSLPTSPIFRNSTEIFLPSQESLTSISSGMSPPGTISRRLWKRLFLLRSPTFLGPRALKFAPSGRSTTPKWRPPIGWGHHFGQLDPIEDDNGLRAPEENLPDHLPNLLAGPDIGGIPYGVDELWASLVSDDPTLHKERVAGVRVEP